MHVCIASTSRLLSGGMQAKTSAEDDPLNTSPAVSEVARKALAKASDACRRIGWFSFWAQLTLSIISACILLFSVAFTSQVRHSLNLNV